MNIFKNKKLTLVLTFSIIVTSFLLGCGNNSASKPTDNGGEAEEKELVVAYDRDAETLDHIKTAWYSDALIYVYDRLVSRDYDFNFKPGLAKEWEMSEDGLTWTFHLKEDVKFHDGKDLTAEDVKWTLETIIDPEVASPAQSDFAAIKEVIVVDEYTVDVNLNYNFPNILYVLSSTGSGIISKEAYEEFGDDYGNKNLVGSGPYKFEEWIKGDKIVLSKNEDYAWGPDWMENNGKAIIDKIVMRVIPEENSRLMELESGSVDVLRDVTAVLMDKLKNNDQVEILSGEASKLGYLGYATDKKPFDDIKVRQALNHALNKEQIIKYVFRDNAQVAHGYLPPMLKEDYYENSKEDGYEYDVEKAKELLKEAGYPDGLTLKLSAENSTEYSRLAEVIQDQLKDVGINADIQLYDSASYTDMLKSGEQELFIREYSWSNADILDWFLLSSQAPYPNHSRWMDEETDRLLGKASSMPTLEERGAAYKEAQKHLIKEAVWVPIYIPDYNIAISKRVINPKYHPWIIQFNDGVDIKN